MQPLPGNIVRLTRSSQGITLYFPPLRNPASALTLVLFGASCFIPGFFASISIAPLADYGPGGMIAIWLMSAFILPFVAFGLLFAALAVFQVSNSLTVQVSPSEIRSERRIFGIALGERRVASADVTAIDVMAVLRYRWPRDDTAHYNLVVRTNRGATPAIRKRRITVAESLRGEALRDEVHTAILRAARLEHIATERSPPGEDQAG